MTVGSSIYAFCGQEPGRRMSTCLQGSHLIALRGASLLLASPRRWSSRRAALVGDSPHWRAGSSPGTGREGRGSPQCMAGSARWRRGPAPVRRGGAGPLRARTEARCPYGWRASFSVRQTFPAGGSVPPSDAACTDSTHQTGGWVHRETDDIGEANDEEDPVPQGALDADAHRARVDRWYAADDLRVARADYGRAGPWKRRVIGFLPKSALPLPPKPLPVSVTCEPTRPWSGSLPSI